MFALRTIARSPVTSQVTCVAARALSTQTFEAVQKLKTVLDDYRLAHYTQELPTRFKKDIAKAAVVHDDFVGMTGVERVLANIGAEQRLSKHDLELIFQEVGKDGEMPASSFIQII